MKPPVPHRPPPRGTEPCANYAHALESLLELGCEMGASLDLFQTADLLLFNLMGQFGVSRSALWLLGEDGGTAVLMRAHGFPRDALLRLDAVAGEGLRARCTATRSPLTAALAFDDAVGEADAAARAAGVEVVGPVHGRGALLGWIVLGPRVSGAAWNEAELHVVEAALGLAGMAVQNAQLHAQALERNRRLIAANEDLAETARLKSEFLSHVNHELRTPLTVVLGSLDCVLEARPPAEIADRMLSAAHESAIHLKELLERLLTFSDSMEGRLIARLERLDPGRYLDEFHAARHPGVAARLYPLAYAREASLPPVSADPLHVRWILDELFDNALKFTPAGTPLRLEARAVAAPGAVEIAVSDLGDGVAAERLEALFEAFVQADGSHTRAVGGLGMGLALARRLAEGMGGSLQAESAPGAGSTFRLRLPAA